MRRHSCDLRPEARDYTASYHTRSANLFFIDNVFTFICESSPAAIVAPFHLDRYHYIAYPWVRWSVQRRTLAWYQTHEFGCATLHPRVDARLNAPPHSSRDVMNENVFQSPL